MAIVTTYEGVEYRSRLEARWAAFFRQIGWQFTYEPFDGDGYIPDFVIHGPHPLLVEIKPAVVAEDYQAPVQKVTAGVLRHWKHDILIVGADPVTRCMGTSWEGDSAGLLGEVAIEDGAVADWTFAPAIWTECGACNKIAVYHDYLSYACRPCGDWEGDHYLNEIDPRHIKAAWSAATNLVKWRRVA